jgi:hypothetical protein
MSLVKELEKVENLDDELQAVIKQVRKSRYHVFFDEIRYKPDVNCYELLKNGEMIVAMHADVYKDMVDKEILIDHRPDEGK